MDGLSNMGEGFNKSWYNRLFKDGVITPRLLLLGILGILLLIGSEFFSPKPAEPIPQPQEKAVAPVIGRSYEEMLEAKLSNLLSQVKGAGHVAVSVTLVAGSAQEHARNIVTETKVTQEKDTGGGTRTITETKESSQILVSRDAGQDRPVMVRELKPVIQGVLVVAEGANDSKVKAQLTHAVQAALGLPAHKVLVLPQRM